MRQDELLEFCDRLKEAVMDFYGQRLISLAVYGSAARRDMRPDSDVDFLICARDLPPGRRARLREFLGIEKTLAPYLERLKQEKVNTALSPIIKTPEEVEFGSLLFLDMIEHSLILHDREGFLANYLAGLKERLAKLGSRKINKGTYWYWELVPKEKLGQEVVL